MRWPRLNKIFLYHDHSAQTLNTGEVAEYLTRKLAGVAVEVRGNLLNALLDKTGYARKIAGAKIQDITRPMSFNQAPLYGEVEHEKRRLSGATGAVGVLYEAVWLQRILWETIPRGERSLDFVHIYLTNRLMATWDKYNHRYHARVSAYGLPSIVSTTGVVEAPAKPREYYLLRQQYRLLGKDPIELKERFRGRFIDYDDERLTEVIKGYAMQAVFYALTGDPFCEDKGCRLYNAHWQEELIFAQLESAYEFCPRHTAIIKGQEWVSK